MKTGFGALYHRPALMLQPVPLQPEAVETQGQLHLEQIVSSVAEMQGDTELREAASLL